jgi:nitroreductase
MGMQSARPGPAAAERDDIDVLGELLARRHSARGYLPDPVARETIEQVVAVASRSPSWCNVQPWHLHITVGEGTERFRERLVGLTRGSSTGEAGPPEPDFPFPSAYQGIYQDRRRDTALRLYGAVGIQRGDRAGSARQTSENFSLFGAPHVAILTTDAELGVYGAVDCGLFLGSLLLAFEACGIAAIPQAAIAMYSPFVHEHLGIPRSRRVICGVSFGREDTAHPANGFRTDRAQVGELVTWIA